MIKVTIDKRKVEFPTSWDEVTYEQYLAIMTSKGQAEVMSILMSIPYDELKGKTVLGIEELFMAAQFVNQIPKFETYYPQVGPYPIPKNKDGQFDIRFESLGQFEDTRETMARVKPDEVVSLVKAYGKAVAIYLQKIRDKEYDHLKVPELESELQKFRACEVIGLGQFFFSKVSELTEWHSKNLPPYAPEIEEVDAGFERLQKTFGVYATVDAVSRKINVPETILYRDWTAQEFWFKHLFLAHQSAAQSEYQKLIMKRK